MTALKNLRNLNNQSDSPIFVVKQELVPQCKAQIKISIRVYNKLFVICYFTACIECYDNETTSQWFYSVV